MSAHNIEISLTKDRYTMVNVWTSEKYRILPGHNCGHISLGQQPGDGYFSLWPGSRSTPSKIESKTWKWYGRFMAVRAPDYMTNYHDDALGEADSERMEINVEITKPKTDELENGNVYIYRKDSKWWGFCYHNNIQGQVLCLDSLDFMQTKNLNSSEFTREQEIAILDKLTQHDSALHKEQTRIEIDAELRICFYSISHAQLRSEFNRLHDSVKGWRLIGSNLLSRTDPNAAENCASLAGRCLKAGGFSQLLNKKQTASFSSEGSSYYQPDDFICYLVAAKIRELGEYPETANYAVEGETPIDKIKELHCNANNKEATAVVCK